MISFLIKYKRAILIITLAFFIGSIAYIGLDSYQSGAFRDKIAMVGNTPITYRMFSKATDTQIRALQKNGLDIDAQMSNIIKQQVLSGLINEEILNQAAEEFGIAVADYEVALDIHSSPLFSQNGQFNKQAYEDAVKYQVGATPAQFEEQIRRSKLADRFRMALYSIYKLTPEEVRFSYLTQNGNMKNFEKNKADFEKQLFETKMETAQQAFLEDFNNRVQIKTFLDQE
ncbi:MAG: SurA N-terminal domain-containing protein [Elusimicrobiaceae bacterium]|nr:SurA N-terminal domain-containing protein [Elusimicrobiaceae bacterium]